MKKFCLFLVVYLCLYEFQIIHFIRRGQSITISSLDLNKCMRKTPCNELPLLSLTSSPKPHRQTIPPTTRSPSPTPPPSPRTRSLLDNFQKLYGILDLQYRHFLSSKQTSYTIFFKIKLKSFPKIRSFSFKFCINSWIDRLPEVIF